MEAEIENPPSKRVRRRERPSVGDVCNDLRSNKHLTEATDVHPEKLEDARTVVSISLKKCLVDTERCTLAYIERMVDATTWASQRTMWMANLVVLKCLENDLEPPALTRDFLFKCFQYSCQAKMRGAIDKRPFDYDTSEIHQAQRAKVNARLKIQGVSLLKACMVKSYQDEVLTPQERDVALAVAGGKTQKREQEARALAMCDEMFVRIRVDAGFDDLTIWCPDSARPSKTKSGQIVKGAFEVAGLSDQMEQVIRAELVPNAITYISESYRQRRRVYIEDVMSKFFKTKAHTSRVATHMEQIIDGVVPALLDGVEIDWTPVRGRIRTDKLRKSFEEELKLAESGDDQNRTFRDECVDVIKCMKSIPATTENLKKQPHAFLRPMHYIQRQRCDALDWIQQVAAEVDGDAVNKPNVDRNEAVGDEEDEESDEEDEGAALTEGLRYDIKKYRSVFALLPMRKGHASFLFLDKKRAESMGLPVSDEDSWSSTIFKFSDSLAPDRLNRIIHNSFRTDGVQIKVSLQRPGCPSDILSKRGFAKLHSRTSDVLELERRGVFELTNTHSLDHTNLLKRGVVGLDPGVKDVYTSVMNSTAEIQRRDSHHISNDEWSHLQRTRLIRRKDHGWRTVSGIALRSPMENSILTGLSLRSPKVGRYTDLLVAVKYRMLNAKTMWSYQMRRNRRVYRFSRLIATKSATERACDAIIHHRRVFPRVKDHKRVKKTRQRRRGRTRKPKESLHTDVKLRPIVVFGGGQYASGGNGLASVPRKALIATIAHKTVVCIADENNTSQKCSDCGSQLVHPDLRPLVNNCRIGRERKFTIPQKRRLRQCTSETCSGIRSQSHADGVRETYHKHWNRDVNAAINILNIGIEWWTHHRRPRALCRKSSDSGTQSSPNSPCIQPDITLHTSKKRKKSLSEQE